MQRKKIGAILIALSALVCFCCSCSSQDRYASADGDPCGFSPFRSQPTAKKMVVHPAPGTPIGGDYTRY